MSLYVQLAKHGDILSVLPILQEEYRETHIKPSLLVAKEYSEIPLELPWLHTIVFDGHWQDLKGAVKMAKGYSVPTLIPQTFGDGWPVQRKHPSFQLDQWDRCGRLHQWGTLPLDLPRRTQTSVGLATPRDFGHPFILFADHSQSSPFPHKEDLATRLKDTFPQHQIVRLSSIRTPRLLDLLTLYDAADLLVTVETMHLHLSLATKTPVIALATDNPSRWHGSAYHPRFALHVRYGDYENRKAELLHVAWRAVNKVPAPAVQPIEKSHEFGYNMSVLRVGDKLLKTYRFHPGKSWRTEMAIETNGKTLPIIFPEVYDKFSHEDGRLFMRQGKIHLSATISRSRLPGENSDRSITGFGELVDEGSKWTLKNWTVPKYQNNNWSGQAKNLVFFEA